MSIVEKKIGEWMNAWMNIVVGYAMCQNNNNNNNKLEQSISQPIVYKSITFRIDEYFIGRKQFYREC